MNRIIFGKLGLVFTVLLLTNCGRSDDTTIHVKSPATGDRQLVVKSSCAFGKTFTLPPDSNGKSSTMAAVYVFVANYDLACDTGFNFPSYKNPENDDEVLIQFILEGTLGSTAKSPTIGTYSVKPRFGPNGDAFMRIPPESVEILSRQRGVPNKKRLDDGGPAASGGLAGSVTLKSVSGDTMTGEINLAAVNISVTGAFTARIVATEK